MPPKHATNGDSWWGDGAWKTTRNNNTVSPESLGNAPGLSQPKVINEPAPPRRSMQSRASVVQESAPAKPAQPQPAAFLERTEIAAVVTEPALPAQSKQRQVSVVKEPAELTPIVAEPSLQKEPIQPRPIEPTRVAATQEIATRDIAHVSQSHGQITSKRQTDS